MKIALIREISVANKTAHLFTKHGIKTLIAPIFTKINYDFTVKQNINNLIVTSNNALESLNKFNPNVNIFVVGEQTYINLKDYKNANFIGNQVNDLIKYFENNPQLQDFLYLRGRDITYDLANHFAFIDDQIVYEMKTVPRFSVDFTQVIIQGQISGISFFSQRSLNIFIELSHKAGILSKLKMLDAFCFSKKIAKNIPDGMFKSIVYSTKSNMTDFIKIIRGSND